MKPGGIAKILRTEAVQKLKADPEMKDFFTSIDNDGILGALAFLDKPTVMTKLAVAVETALGKVGRSTKVGPEQSARSQKDSTPMINDVPVVENGREILDSEGTTNLPLTESESEKNRIEDTSTTTVAFDSAIQNDETGEEMSQIDTDDAMVPPPLEGEETDGHSTGGIVSSPDPRKDYVSAVEADHLKRQK
eukprot:g6296.t1